MGSRSRTAGADRPRQPARSGAPSGMPIGTTRSSPVCHLPGAIRCPSLAAWKLTVRSASTAAPSISPLEASTPEAMSQAITGAPQRLIASIAPAAGSRGAPLKPVPKIASTTAPGARQPGIEVVDAALLQLERLDREAEVRAGAAPRPGRRRRCCPCRRGSAPAPAGPSRRRPRPAPYPPPPSARRRRCPAPRSPSGRPRGSRQRRRGG